MQIVNFYKARTHQSCRKNLFIYLFLKVVNTLKNKRLEHDSGLKVTVNIFTYTLRTFLQIQYDTDTPRDLTDMTQIHLEI